MELFEILAWGPMAAPVIGKGISSIAPALKGGIISIGNTLLGNQSRKKESKRAFEYSKRMFDYQNAYNTPAKQMERLKKAGLNPALMYGQGTTGNAQGYPQMQPQQMQNPLQLEALRSIAEIKNIDANTNKTNKEAGIKDIEMDVLSSTKQEQIQEVTERLALLVSQKKISKSDEAYALYRARLSDKGINVNDPIIYRVISQIINKYFPQLSEQMSTELENEMDKRNN